MIDPEVQAQIAALWAEIKRLQVANDILPETEQAFRERLNISSFAELRASGSSPSNIAVDEAGAASYEVGPPMDGYREMTIGGGTVIYIPYRDTP